jgi:hypothetical protein
MHLRPMQVFVPGDLSAGLKQLFIPGINEIVPYPHPHREMLARVFKFISEIKTATASSTVSALSIRLVLDSVLNLIDRAASSLPASQPTQWLGYRSDGTTKTGLW